MMVLLYMKPAFREEELWNQRYADLDWNLLFDSKNYNNFTPVSPVSNV
jgi:hypothetical protein